MGVILGYTACFHSALLLWRFEPNLICWILDEITNLSAHIFALLEYLCPSAVLKTQKETLQTSHALLIHIGVTVQSSILPEKGK